MVQFFPPFPLRPPACLMSFCELDRPDALSRKKNTEQLDGKSNKYLRKTWPGPGRSTRLRVKGLRREKRMGHCAPSQVNQSRHASGSLIRPWLLHLPVTHHSEKSTLMSHMSQHVCAALASCDKFRRKTKASLQSSLGEFPPIRKGGGGLGGALVRVRETWKIDAILWCNKSRGHP